MITFLKETRRRACAALTRPHSRHLNAQRPVCTFALISIHVAIDFVELVKETWGLGRHLLHLTAAKGCVDTHQPFLPINSIHTTTCF